jgi:hypothetical protein
LVVLLTGCAASDKALDRAMTMRQQLQSSGCRFDCTVTADYGAVIHSFTMRCAADQQGTLTFEVLSPESISGITGTISQSKGKLTFDDKALAFDLLADGQLSPVSAPWVLIHTLRGGYLASCAEIEGGMLLSIDDSYEEDPLRLDIRMDEDGKPKSAEILWQGRRILSMEVENFEFV